MLALMVLVVHVTVAVTGLVCPFGFRASPATGRLFRTLRRVLYGMPLGPMPWAGLPLGICQASRLRGGVLASSALRYYLVAFYLVTLLVETTLSLPVGDGDKLSRKVV